MPSTTKYAPKRKKFTTEGFRARLHVAAMDHNYGTEREHAHTRSGHLRYKFQYSIASADYVVKPIKTGKEHKYRQELLLGITDRCKNGKISDSL